MPVCAASIVAVISGLSISRLRACLAIAAAGLLAACGSAAPAPPASGGSAPASVAAAPAQLTPVGIQISATGLAFFPLFVARDLGIFQQHGVDAKLLTMPPPTAIP